MVRVPRVTNVCSGPWEGDASPAHGLSSPYRKAHPRMSTTSSETSSESSESVTYLVLGGRPGNPKTTKTYAVVHDDFQDALDAFQDAVTQAPAARVRLIERDSGKVHASHAGDLGELEDVWGVLVCAPAS